ncbi:MAG: FtsW/RodA/SpoVE family cell cycle protein [Trueperaceae bacterium]
MDSLLIFMQLLLGMLGVLGVATSSPSQWPEQLFNVGLGLFVTFAVSRFNPRGIVKLNPIIFGSTLIALIAVLSPLGLSPEGSESNRWLPLPGGKTWQPSELAKIAVIVYLASFFHHHVGRWELWRPTVVIGFMAALILLEPNISTTLFIFALAFTIMLAAGTTVTRLASITSAAALVATLFAGVYLSISGMSYPQQRLEAFLNPSEHEETLSYQALQAQKVLRRSGFVGIGPGRPVPVPEAHTDMVAIAIAQALGLTGIASLIIAYLIIAWRGIRIASLHHGPGSLLAAGSAAYICGQAALNLLVASGMLPVTGVVLPFVSHGFNNLVSVSIAMGFMHSAFRSFRKEGVTV